MYPTTERRLVFRLLEYWHTLRGDREMPALGNLRFKAFGADIDSCVVLAIGATLGDISLGRLGADIKPQGWDAVKGRSLADCPAGSLLALIVQHIPETVRGRAPLTRGGYFKVGGVRMLGRAILLPLSDDGVRVSHVLAGVNYKKAIQDTARPKRRLRSGRVKGRLEQFADS